MRIQLLTIILFLFINPGLNSQILSVINLDSEGGGKENIRDDIRVVQDDNDNSTKKIKFSLMPAKTAEQAEGIWLTNTTYAFLTMTALNTSRNSSSAYIDLYTDLLGPMKVSISTIVATAKSDTLNGANQNDIERFLSGGGNAVLNFTLMGPTVWWKDSKSYATILLNPRIAFDLPSLGAITDDKTVNSDIGLECRFHVPLYKKVIGFVGSYRLAYVFGSRDFYSNLGIEQSDTDGFAYSQISLGFNIPASKWSIVWNKTLSGPDLLKDIHKSGRISFLITPQTRK